MRLLMTADEIMRDPAGWARERDALVGASDIGSIMGLDDAYRSAHDLYWSKTLHEDSPDTMSFRIGRHFESLVLQLFAESNPDLAVEPGGLYVSDVRPWQSATFDALAIDKNGETKPVQAKTTYSFSMRDEDGRPIWGEPPDGQIPGPYLAQCMQEIDVADAGEGLLPVLPTGTRQPPRVYVVKRDEDEIALLRSIGGDFARRLADGNAPKPGWRDVRRLKSMYADDGTRTTQHISRTLGKRARAAKRSLKRAERRWEAVEAELRHRMGIATAAAVLLDDGTEDVIATRSLFDERRVAIGEMRDAHPGIVAEFTRKSPVDKMLIKQPRVNR